MLKVTRREGETWRECVKRYGQKNGLEADCLAEFAKCVAVGMRESEAAFSALEEWDCLDFVDEPKAAPAIAMGAVIEYRNLIRGSS